MSQITITGGNGKTGKRLAEQLRGRGLQARIASRSARGASAVRFDWHDAATFAGALNGTSALYLVAPTDSADALGAMRTFLEMALQRGVEKLVLLSASSLEAGGPMMGAVHEFLRDNAPHWFVLRPTWFMQNFSEGPHQITIRDENAIYSATQKGRVPFIHAGDIAAVAATALTSDLPNRDAVLTGPQTLSYDEVAAILSEVTGRSIVHQRLSEAQLAQRYRDQGLPADYAPILAAMDTAIAGGSEDRVTAEVQTLTGHAPNDFRSFARAAHANW